MSSRAILVVDDEPEVREIVLTILRLAGYEVAGAEHGGEALRELEQRSYDVVITDLLMPDKDGVETIREVRKRFPQLRIIAMSGGGHVAKESYLKMAQVFGANALLAKPFSRDELLRTVATVLATGGEASPGAVPPS